MNIWVYPSIEGNWDVFMTLLKRLPVKRFESWTDTLLSTGVSMLMHVLFVCFITKSFLTYSFFPPTPALSSISRPLSSSMCSITPETANVGSSHNRMRGSGIGCWFSDRSNCSHWSLTLTLTNENLSLYTTLLLLLVLIQLCSPRCSWLQLLSYKV